MDEVYAIEKKPGAGGSPLLVVWTDNPNDGAEHFDKVKGSIIQFLQSEEGTSLDGGYLMDVFGPSGALLHRLDARQ